MAGVLRFLKWSARSKPRSGKPRNNSLGLPPYHRRLLCEALEVRALLSVGIAASGLGDGIQAGGASPQQTLADLPIAAQTAISSAIGQDQAAYHAASAAGGATLANPANGFTAQLQSGVLQVSAGPDTWDMSLAGLGYGGAVQPVGTAQTTVNGNRVDCNYATVDEWYVNGPDGLEQGFTVPPPPQSESNGSLTLELTLGGDLVGTVNAADGLTLARPDGSAALGYTGLAACDAAGKTLPASLQVRAEGGRQELLIHVNGAGAQGPITIDPFVQQAKLTASDGGAGNNFGTSVAISGNTVVVGSPYATVGGNGGEGVAYVFTEGGSGWASMTQTAKLTASDGAAGDSFGTSVAISGNTVVVGAPCAAIGANTYQGAAYVFTEPGTGWANMTQTAKLTESNGGYGDNFGTSVAVSGNTVVVGSPYAMVGDSYPGAAYVFTEPGAGWVNMTQTAELTASGGAYDDQFGTSVSISGNTLVVGAPYEIVPDGAFGSTVPATRGDGGPGEAYVFTEPGSGWANMTQTAELTASDGEDGDWFGYSVAISGNTVVAGAPEATVGSNGFQGAAYVFTEPGAGWANMSQTAKLTPSNGGYDYQFGTSVSIGGNTIVVGSPYATVGGNTSQGAAYVFTEPGAAWANMVQTATFTSSDGAAKDQFGTSLSIDGNTVVVGSPYATVGANSYEGAAYAFGTPIPGIAAVSTTAAANSCYKVGGTVPITVTFNETVNVSGTPQLTLNDGAVVNYASGSGTTTLTFSYVVAAGQNTADLDYASTAALALNGGSIKDLAGNAAVLTLLTTGTDGLATKNIGIETTPPTASAVSTTAAANSYYKVGGTVPITVTFNVAVNVSGTPRLALNDGAVVNYSGGSGTATLTFTYTVAAGQNTTDLDYASTSALALNGGSIYDLAGNAAALTLPATGSDGLAMKDIEIETTPPTVSAVSTTAAANSYYKVGGTVAITVTFSDAVMVLGAAELTLNDGAVANITSGNQTATLTFTYTVAAGQNTADLDYASTSALTINGAIVDLALNTAVLTLPATGSDGLALKDIGIDTTPPTVNAVSTTAAANSRYKVGGTVPIAVTFSEPVNVSGTPQLTLNDGAVVNCTTGSGTATLTFSYTVAAGQNTADLDYASTAALALNGGSIQDLAGNAAVLTLPATGSDGLATKDLLIDTTPPTATAVSTTAVASSYYTVGETVPIAVTFSEPVNVSGTPQLTLNDGAVVNYASGSGTATLTFSYTVAAGQNTADLDYASTAALALNGGSIQDLAGNTAVLTLPATGGDGLATKDLLIDTTPPTATAVSTTAAADSYFTVGGTVPIAVTFSEPVIVSGTPQLTLNDGAVVNYASGSGTATLTFSYTVAAGQNTADLDYASTSALALNGGGIQDMAGNAAVLTLPATGSDGLATAGIVIDTTPQTVSAVSTTAAANSRYTAGGTVPIAVAFSEPVNVSGTPQLTLNDGGTANYTSGSGTATLTFSYTVATGQTTADLDYASTSALALNGGSIQDLVGNAAVLTLPATGSDGLATADIVIYTPPKVNGVMTSAALNARYTVGGTVLIGISFTEAISVSGTPQLTLNDGAVANYIGSGSGVVVFSYTVAAGQNTADLDYASTTALALNGGSIRDSAGDSAVLTLPATGSDGLATKNIVIDTTPPTASAVSTTAAAGSTYGTGGTVPIAVAFSEPVIVNGTPQLTLNDGAVVNYTSGSGTATLTFSYVVVAGQNTTDLDYASTAALALNGGSIQDLAGNAAVLTLPATGSDGLATAGIVIDTATLTVTAADWTSAGLTLMLGGDGNLHVYITGTTTDAVAPCPPASVTCIAIAAPGSTTANLTIDSTAGDPVPAGGLNFCGAGGLIITGSGTVALPSTNTYTGGTTVSSGTLWINAADALPNNGGLTVGAGGTVILDPLSGGPTIATASTMASDASATNAVPSSTGAAASSLILSAPTNVLPSPPGTVRSMVALPKGEGSYGTAYQPITGGLAWVGQAESSADNSDLHHKKAAAILALEAVFAQYGL